MVNKKKIADKNINFAHSDIEVQDCQLHELAWIVAAEERRGVTPMTTLKALREYMSERGVPEDAAHEVIEQARIFFEAHLSEGQREIFVRKLYEQR